MNYHCFRCGKELSNEVSVRVGIGPICRAKIKKKAEDQQRKENLQCHHGLTCYAPNHAATTIGRFKRRFEIIAQHAALDNEIKAEVCELITQVIESLGLDRDSVLVPEIEIPRFGPQTIITLGIKATVLAGVDLILCQWITTSNIDTFSSGK